MPKQINLATSKKHVICFSDRYTTPYTISTQRHDAKKKHYKRLKKALAEPQLSNRDFYELS